MMKIKLPILRARTKQLTMKLGHTIGTYPLPNIYIIGCAAPSGILSDFPTITCLSNQTLKHLWSKEPRISYASVPDPLWSKNIPAEFKIFNRQMLYAGYGDPVLEEEERPNMNLFDLGLNAKMQWLNPVASAAGRALPEFRDMFSTSDGKVFAVTQRSGWTGTFDDIFTGTAVLYCFDLEGNEIAHHNFDTKYGKYVGYSIRKITGQLEADGVFRIYAVGWDGQGPTDPDDEYAMDCVFCLKFDGETFTEEWYYYDTGSYNTVQLIDNAGRGYSIYAMKPIPGNEKQCCVVSTLVNYAGYPQCMARITKFNAWGTPARVWNIPLNDPDNAPTVSYGIVANETLLGNQLWGIVDFLECANIYRHSNQFLYFRGCSTYYPSTLFRVNLTTGATEEQLTTVTWDGGKRIRLAGLYDSEADPLNCDRLLMYDMDKIVMVSLADLTTELYSKTSAEVFPVQRVGAGMYDYAPKFGYVRISSQLNFSTV